MRRIIVCGSRHYKDAGSVWNVIDGLGREGPQPTIITGGAPGADQLADEAAAQIGFGRERFTAEWDRLGKAAGPRRNQRMVDAGADLLIAFGTGRGTEDCVSRAEKAQIPVRREA